MKDYITVKEAAALKKVSTARIYQWIREGRLASRVDRQTGLRMVLPSRVTRVHPLPRGRKRLGITEEKRDG